MKTFLVTTIALLALTITCKAQWTLTGGNIYPTTLTNNVGIGTTTPNSLLHVNGTSAVVTVSENRTTGLNMNGIFSASTNTSQGQFGSIGNNANAPFNSLDGVYMMNRTSGSNLYFTTNNLGVEGKAMTITSSGNVGIGEVNPAYKLFVNSQNNSSSASVLFHGKYYGSSISTEQTAAPYYALDVRGGATPSGGSGNSLLYVRADGNISIGTTDSKGYKFAVNGSAIATSMTVKLYANWPDYVFKKDYQLPSLREVKAYIDQNRHLPEIPSAEEIAKDGLNLGEMNKLLMKKVEELTLYLIEKDKTEKEQQGKLLSQQAQLTAQQLQIDQLVKQVSRIANK
jgi:hypothetical protein